jgi:hypothetical protein
MHIADTSLTPAEKDDEETERLISKKPPPCRKYKSKRGPKFDNRRRRMKVDDKDLKSKKSFINNLSDIALKIMIIPNIAASNKAFRSENMTARTAEYHGVLQQGHPSGPTNTGYHSIDKRYFGKERYDSIISSAKELLNSDWIKYGWDGGSPDARFRAALDIAIQTADSNLYAGKIDPETYNMLLVNLTGSEDDLFSETFVGGKAKKASTMTAQNYKNLVAIADSLRKSYPKIAFSILKNLEGIRTAEQQQGQQFFTQEQQAPCAQQQDQQAPCAQEQQGQQEQQSGKLSAPEVKKQLDLITKVRDGEDLAEVLGKLLNCVHAASSRIAADVDPIELESIADMSDEEVVKLINSIKPEVKKVEDSLKSMGEPAAITDEQAEDLIRGIEELIGIVQESATKAKTASIRVNIATLVKLVHEIPETREILKSLLITAKKKVDKAKKKKTSQGDKKKPEDDDKKDPNPKDKGKKPSPGKKAPPFGGKKAPPFGKGKGKKASDISVDDSDW